MPEKIRVLIAKVGLDGHDRGAKLIANALKDAGMEVIYLGLRQTIAQVVAAAIEEDVEYIGLSFLAGDHLTLVPKLFQELANEGVESIKIIIGGIIPKNHIPNLLAIGVKQVFLPGTPLSEIASFIQENR
ncbi:MAG: cobalamin-dependent protein [Anaerolineae bacterium]|nr:cobalamin-dependent protein [Anaerolineae bacterium]